MGTWCDLQLANFPQFNCLRRIYKLIEWHWSHSWLYRNLSNFSLFEKSSQVRRIPNKKIRFPKWWKIDRLSIRIISSNKWDNINAYWLNIWITLAVINDNNKNNIPYSCSVAGSKGPRTGIVIITSIARLARLVRVKPVGCLSVVANGNPTWEV